jgi:hypothetical protein
MYLTQIAVSIGDRITCIKLLKIYAKVERTVSIKTIKHKSMEYVA